MLQWIENTCIRSSATKKLGREFPIKQKIVREFIVPHGRQNAQRNRDDNCCTNCQNRQQKRRRELGHKGLKHVASGNVADAHVSGQYPANPCQILRQKRLIESKLGALGIDDLLRYRALVAVKLGDRVAARDSHHGEGQKCDADENRYELQKSFENIFFQNISLLKQRTLPAFHQKHWC